MAHNITYGFHYCKYGGQSERSSQEANKFVDSFTAQNRLTGHNV